MSRQEVPDKIAVEVLAANHHTCCICRERRKHVQLHHIDEDHANSVPGNLAVVCLDDHSRVTGDEGLGRKFTPREVRQYKLQWETICAHAGVPDEDEEEADGEVDDEADEPLVSVFQSRLIRANDECAFAFDMEAGQELICSISADDYVDVSICTARAHKKWLDGEDLSHYEGEEDVRECELPTFVAPRDGKFVVLVMNDNDEGVDATVDISIWAASEDDNEEDED
jgi:hypothetical protein